MLLSLRGYRLFYHIQSLSSANALLVFRIVTRYDTTVAALCTHRQCFAKPHAVRQDAALTWVLSVTQLVHRLHHVVPHKLYRCMCDTTNHMNYTAVCPRQQTT